MMKKVGITLARGVIGAVAISFGLLSGKVISGYAGQTFSGGVITALSFIVAVTIYVIVAMAIKKWGEGKLESGLCFLMSMASAGYIGVLLTKVTSLSDFYEGILAVAAGIVILLLAVVSIQLLAKNKPLV